jgi:hypothetical protein
MTDHRFCLHSRTREGRAACRRAGSPAGYHRALQLTLTHEGEKVCSDCFWKAIDYADGIIREANPEAPEFIIRAMAYVLGRELMYDQGGIVACTAHAHIID